MRYKLGIDVGGTNTDAVLLDENANVVAELKHPTTKDIYSGIDNALCEILELAKVKREDVGKAMLGTTQCTNAIVERKNLAPIGVLRIGAPATTGIMPMTGWADDLKTIAVETAVIGGGFEYDGKTLAELDEAAAIAFFEKLKGRAQAVAIICVFSTVRNDHELRAAELCRQVMGEDTHISISSEIGSISLLERENATILNAALHKVAYRFTESFAKSLADEGLTNADIYISQNDGTLMSMEYARRYPVLTIACGTTNSIRGASYLSGLKNAVIIDVGGTTTDVGVIQSGFPRESSLAVTIGGVRTNFRMPDVISIGLGGGSIVWEKDGRVMVGPASVGHEITQKALVFGGDVITATDIAVRCGLVKNLGDAAKAEVIDLAFAQKALARITEMVETAIDAIKVSGRDMDVVLVGGGAIILPDKIRGAAEVYKPKHSPTANAIGCAISKVSGTYEKLISYDETPREQALEHAKAEAVCMAVTAGAKRETVEIIDIEDIPLQYYPGNTCRVKIKAAGEIY